MANKNEAPVDQPALTIEEAAEKIERAVARLRSGRLNDRAIIVLLQDDTGLPRKVIKTVLDSIGRLPIAFLKKDAVNKPKANWPK